MGGWSLILLVLVIALVGFAVLIAALVLVLRLSQRWIDGYYARRGEGYESPSAAELYMESLRRGRKHQATGEPPEKTARTSEDH